MRAVFDMPIGTPADGARRLFKSCGAQLELFIETDVGTDLALVSGSKKALESVQLNLGYGPSARIVYSRTWRVSHTVARPVSKKSANHGGQRRRNPSP